MPPSAAGWMIVWSPMTFPCRAASVVVALVCSARILVSCDLVRGLADLRTERVDTLLGLVDLLVERLHHQVLLALQLICPEREESLGHGICSEHSLIG